MICIMMPWAMKINILACPKDDFSGELMKHFLVISTSIFAVIGFLASVVIFGAFVLFKIAENDYGKIFRV